MRTLAQSVVQAKTGMRIKVMPGARILMIVQIILMPESRVPMPAICRPQM